MFQNAYAVNQHIELDEIELVGDFLQQYDDFLVYTKNSRDVGKLNDMIDYFSSQTPNFQKALLGVALVS